MKPLGEVKEILGSRKDLSVARCARKCQQLLQSMYQEVYGDHTPMPSLTGTPKQPQNRQSTLAVSLFQSADEDEEGQVTISSPSFHAKTTPRKRNATKLFSKEFSTLGSAKKKKKSVSRSEPKKSMVAGEQHRGLSLAKSPSPASKQVSSKRNRKKTNRFDEEYSSFSTKKTTQDESDEESEECDENTSLEEVAMQDDDSSGGSKSEIENEMSDDEEFNLDECVEKEAVDEEMDSDEQIEEEEGLLEEVEESIKKARLESSKKGRKVQIDSVSSDDEATSRSSTPRLPASLSALATPDTNGALHSRVAFAVAKKTKKQKRTKWSEKETHAVKVS